jgi:hypothetical protein
MQIGEVIGGSLSKLLVDVKRDEPTEDLWPVDFGSFVKIRGRDRDLIGVVVDMYYEPLERGKPRPRWLEEKKILDRIYPDLHEKHMSLAEVFTLGYWKGRKPCQKLPAFPPPIHSAVELIGDEGIKGFHSTDSESQKVRLDYVNRMISELGAGRCLDLLKVIVDKLEALGMDRNELVSEITSFYIALGQEEMVPLVSSWLSQGE